MPAEQRKKARAYYVSLIIALSVQPARTLRRFLPFDGYTKYAGQADGGGRREAVGVVSNRELKVLIKHSPLKF